MKHKYLKNVATLGLEQEKCIGCGMCEDVCPHRVFAVSSGKAHIMNDACMECGACALNCPVKAIEVKAGVGCASAIIKGWLTSSEPSCDCLSGDCC
ncbi:MAG: 4Fe-4S binding protein [Deltaproteobacteria bacterium]|nr:4Fe-4S binding protein [Deltaproteobacteria bacterium]